MTDGTGSGTGEGASPGARGGERHLTALDLDQLDLGGLTAPDRQRIDAHTQRCARCAARRSQHESSTAHFRGAVFPRTAAAIVARRGAAPAGLWRLAIALPVGAALLLVLAHTFESKRARENAGTLGIKGDALMEVFARRRVDVGTPDTGDAAAMRVADGARLAPGDALRFVLFPTGLPYVLIVSVDGTGQVSVYFPFRGQASAPIDGSMPLSVPGSIVLDRASGPERLFAIFSESPLEAQTVRETLARTTAGGAQAIRSAARLPLPGTVQATLLFEKDHETEHEDGP